MTTAFIFGGNMLPTIKLFGKLEIGMYGTMFVIGFFLAIFIARKIYKYANKEDILYSAIYAVLGMIVGMKLLFMITKLPKLIRGFSMVAETFDGDTKGLLGFSVSYLLGGNVFYGGLIGAVIGILIYCRIYKVKVKPLADLYAIMIPFVHAFGRIGCFFAGCCYGMEYHGFGAIQFPDNKYIPELSEVPRVPTQLIEVVMNFICFGVLLYLYKKNKITEGKLVGCYICYYSVFRFINEFFRGDVVRGAVFGLYTSQIVSLCILPIGLIILCTDWFVKRMDKE